MEHMVETMVVEGKEGQGGMTGGNLIRPEKGAAAGTGGMRGDMNPIEEVAAGREEMIGGIEILIETLEGGGKKREEIRMQGNQRDFKEEETTLESLWKSKIKEGKRE